MSSSSESEIHQSEVRITQALEISATTLQTTNKILGIPEDVNGLVVADLASGACPLVADLLDRGAQAYGVDRLYEQPEELDAHIAEYLRRLPFQVPPRYREHMQTVTLEAIERFRRSFHLQRGHYLAGWLSKIPLADNLTDLTVSLNGISDFSGEFCLTGYNHRRDPTHHQSWGADSYCSFSYPSW